MAKISHHQLSTDDRPLSLYARRDVLEATAQFAGQAAYVLKDPLTLELFHLTAEEFFLFQAVKVRTTLSALRKEFERRFAPRRITTVALQEGLNQLHGRGLLLSESPAQGEELLERHQRRRRQEWLQNSFSLLSIRLVGFDATSWVDGLYGCFRWVFSLPGLLLALGLVLAAVRVLLVELPRLTESFGGLAELSQPRYWLLWIATIAIVKCIHELAHALTCKHVGGRCHEIGIMLLAFFPCLYCDVTDVWRISSKWRRIAVSSAGMVVELVIAAVALLCWSQSQPGIFNLWCLSLVTVCSVGTLLINANPLLRYDGYYILSDLLEVPNLATRSRGLLSERIRNWLLNQPTRPDPLLGPKRRRALMLYAISAKVYLTFVVVLIFAGLIAVVRPYHLENVVYTLAVITLIGMMIAPAMAMWRLWRNPGARHRFRIGRAFLLLSLLGGVLAGVFCWPIERSIQGPVVMVPRDAQTVYAQTSGRLAFAVPEGSVVKKGDVLARLADESLNLAVAEQEGVYNVQRVGYRQIRAMRTWDQTANAREPTARAALADAKAQLEEHRRNAEQLVLTAPADGIVIAPPRVPPQDASPGQLPTWTGTPLDARNLGCWVEESTVLCSVGDPNALIALLAVEEADVPEVAPGQKVRILVASSPVRVLEGEVVEIASRGITPEHQTSTVNSTKRHLVEVRLTAADPLALVGTRGDAKIEASRRTLWEIAYRELEQLLKLPW